MEHDKFEQCTGGGDDTRLDRKPDELVDDSFGLREFAPTDSKQLQNACISPVDYGIQTAEKRTRYNMAPAMMTSAATAPPSQTIVRR